MAMADDCARGVRGLRRVPAIRRQAECRDVSKLARLSILYVAYPLLTVSEDSAGGAEQMLFTLEREMAAAGHRTTVAASKGSKVSGTLLVTGMPAPAPD